MICLFVGAKDTNSLSHDAGAELGRGVVQDNEIDIIAFEETPKLSDQAQASVETLALACVDLAVKEDSDVDVALDNYGQGEMTPEAVFELGRRADSAGAEALVLSCTDMRSVETLARLEQALDKPVVSSNQAMIFAALAHLGLPRDSMRCGRLFGGNEVT